MIYRPTGKRLFVRRIADVETQLPSGIIIPDAVRKETVRQGVVMSCGPEADPSIQAGDRVLYVRVVGVQSDIVELKDITILHDHEVIAHATDPTRASREALEQGVERVLNGSEAA